MRNTLQICFAVNNILLSRNCNLAFRWKMADCFPELSENDQTWKKLGDQLNDEQLLNLVIAKYRVICQCLADQSLICSPTTLLTLTAFERQLCTWTASLLNVSFVSYSSKRNRASNFKSALCSFSSDCYSLKCIPLCPDAISRIPRDQIQNDIIY